ncbi:Remorin, C-terminal protein [Heracleum sosnowskyi]|uniref:Remorin, C-terminal protein n=1 Tax=Heracleum sosnowskyi TaxID=360622 RepID=A0AAD8NF23_9APIA|nr:Remorin, C-terminal protein [Heracleum sosnowskyi]
MPELGFQDQSQLPSSGLSGTRDVSPDSVIFTAESNFSLFSSASCSVERCSFASDVHDHDSLLSDTYQHLAVHECGESSSSGPDLDPNKSTVYKNSLVCRKVEKAKVLKEDSKVETDDENQALDSARSSFSRALKDCQVRRYRSEALLKKPDRRRPASLDLNNTLTNVTSSSPRFGVLKKSSVLTRRTSTFLSPGTPNYSHTSSGMQKGWSSERVALPTSGSRRNVNNALLPFNNGRTLPSKWEDAERWIFSPVSGDSSSRPSFPQPQRRPKAKSGPLGPPGTAYYSMYSPAVHMFDGGIVENFMAASPFTAGVIAANSFSVRRDTGYGGNGNFYERMEPCIERSASVHGCSETLCQSSFPSSHDRKLDIVEDEGKDISRAVSRRDMATQMSPERSPRSSPNERNSFASSTNSVLPTVGWQNSHSSKQEVRDVQVDERVTMTRWCKKNKSRTTGKGSGNCDDWKRKALEIRSTNWEVSETANSISNIKREEARITAWENLQKAKAEAAIRKLEMKLEKKRSSSMDKIMKRLKSAQKKAREMRRSDVVNQAHQVATTSHKLLFFRRTRQISSLSGCFTCHAF